MIWIAVIVAGLLIGQALSFQYSMKELSLEMARFANVGVAPIQLQNAITPPQFSNAFIILVVIALGMLVVAGFQGGMFEVVIAMAVLIGALVVSGAVNVATSWPSQKTYRDIIFHSLISREANYRRDGDQMRADAIVVHKDLMLAVIGNQKNANASIAGEIANVATKVVADYGELLEGKAIGFGQILYDERDLPYAKNVILQAICLVLQIRSDPKERKALITCGITLANFQPGIGPDPLRAPGLMDSKEEIDKLNLDSMAAMFSGPAAARYAEFLTVIEKDVAAIKDRLLEADRIFQAGRVAKS